MTQQLRRCLESGTVQNWELFINLIHPVIASAVVRALAGSGLSRSDLADDLIQESFLRLCANGNRALRTFRGTGDASLRAWLTRVATSVTIDHMKSVSAAANGGGQNFVELDDTEFESAASADLLFRQIERGLLKDHLDRWLADESERDVRIFWLYHREGFSPAEIAAHPGMDLAQGGVETTVYRLTKKVVVCARKAGFSGPGRARAEGVGD